jgi:hypothetical protein
MEHHESFDYDQFFTENTDDYHLMTDAESMYISSNENLDETSMKHRSTGKRHVSHCSVSTIV